MFQSLVSCFLFFCFVLPAWGFEQEPGNQRLRSSIARLEEGFNYLQERLTDVRELQLSQREALQRQVVVADKQSVVFDKRLDALRSEMSVRFTGVKQQFVALDTRFADEHFFQNQWWLFLVGLLVLVCVIFWKIGQLSRQQKRTDQLLESQVLQLKSLHQVLEKK